MFTTASWPALGLDFCHWAHNRLLTLYVSTNINYWKSTANLMLKRSMWELNWGKRRIDENMSQPADHKHPVSIQSEGDRTSKSIDSTQLQCPTGCFQAAMISFMATVISLSRHNHYTSIFNSENWWLLFLYIYTCSHSWTAACSMENTQSYPVTQLKCPSTHVCTAKRSQPCSLISVFLQPCGQVTPLQGCVRSDQLLQQLCDCVY